ncbi:RagB/SusD family nutrient uptake outer membrane protein [Sphingobacterium faecale]|uniref:RagB/SusD family nutrient uptake outer membrane protein n=1 Tax=Sphingobacterium faecale TaxID=2803775 RepID=A0ABS1RAB2_9SPHI|nr:RagB/SusD family nutrient uptake outer membrane protein [Sphingobacterium faecale]MBL1411480.1 RagB/SusD family nutrient uptake outer membrane protein [Sphingobacterium faecale]
MNTRYNKWIMPFLGLFIFSGCSKFLEEKSDKSLGVPATIDEFKAVINDWGYLNSDYSSMGEASADDLYLSDADFNGLYYESDKRLYSWMPDYITRPASSAGHEWYACYKSIYPCNAILKGLDEYQLSGREADELRGQALAFRAARYLDGVQIWAPIYNKETANKDLGMVLRTDPDITLPSVRSTVQETYDLILTDLVRAIPLLPTAVTSPSLPTKAAAYGLLARAYLIMGDYEKALLHAEEALKFPHQVIDFNELNSGAAFPIPATNQTSAELIFYTRMYGSLMVGVNTAKVNGDLYSMYDEHDLRKVIYFRKNNENEILFKGTHMGHQGLITGITSAELLLIVAECEVRLNRLDKAAEAMNKLKVKRWDKSKFLPYGFSNQESALALVLAERRRELVWRGLRWVDIKRLNRDGANIILTRNINGKELLLPANDKRYALGIPEDVLEMTGMPQNPR